MKLVLRFREDIVRIVDFPSAPPTFRIPWWKPLRANVQHTDITSTAPTTPMVEFVKESQSGEIAQYQADVSNIRDLF